MKRKEGDIYISGYIIPSRGKRMRYVEVRQITDIGDHSEEYKVIFIVKYDRLSESSHRAAIHQAEEYVNKL